MKKLIALAMLICIALTSNAKPRKYKRGGTVRYQKAYYKKSTGKYVKGHYKTRPDNYRYNNLKRK